MMGPVEPLLKGAMPIALRILFYKNFVTWYNLADTLFLSR